MREDVQRKTLADYLAERNPVSALWPDMFHILFHDKPERDCLERLGPAAQTLWHIEGFRQEVNNGGLSQFFSNPSGDYTRESVDGLRRIGAVLSVQLLERALTVFPGCVAPTDFDERNSQLRAFESEQPRFLWNLTKEFYDRVEPLGSKREEDLDALQAAFMRQHQTRRVCA